MFLAELKRLHESARFEVRAPAGFVWKRIQFVLVLNQAGGLTGIEDTRTQMGVARKYLVPAGQSRTKGTSANLLWDTAEYVLGVARPGLQERAADRHAAFKSKALQLAQFCPAVRPVCAFLNNLPWADFEKSDMWPDIVRTTPVMSFRLLPDMDLVCARPDVLSAIQRLLRRAERDEGTHGICLASGRRETLQRVHPWIFGVSGSPEQRGRLVSFGQRAFESYGGEAPAIHVPIGKSTSSAYAEALNRLLAVGSGQNIRLGDLTLVFWEERLRGFSELFANCIGRGNGAAPANLAQFSRELRRFAARPSGRSRFFALGLEARGSRIPIALWIADDGARMATAISRHLEFADLGNAKDDFNLVTIAGILESASLPSRAGRVSRSLSASMVRAVVLGEPYPKAVCIHILANAHRRGSVDYAGAAFLKAFVNRAVTEGKLEGAVLPKCLDRESREYFYLWGRFFAVCDRIHRNANSKWAASLGNQLYKVVSSRPAPWFEPVLAAAKRQLAGMRSMGGLSGLEAALELIADELRPLKTAAVNPGVEEQGRFAVGYFQQSQQEY